MSRCPRCGKDRIVISSREEVVVNSTVVYTETVCPNPDCQKLVENMLKVEETKRTNLKIEKEKANLQRLKAKEALKANNE